MTGTVTCTFGSLADGANTVLTFVAAIDPGQVDEIDNTATVTGNETDPISQNNSSSHTTEITPIETDLELVKDDGVDAAEPGTDLTYTLTITNHGPGASSGGSVRDPLPAELRFLTSSTGCIEIASIVRTLSHADRRRRTHPSDSRATADGYASVGRQYFLWRCDASWNAASTGKQLCPCGSR